MKNEPEKEFEKGPKGKLPQVTRDKDNVVEALERAERRVMAVSFLLAKIVSVGALLAALVLLEAGVVKRIWATEFLSEQVHAQSVPARIETDAARTPCRCGCARNRPIQGPPLPK